MFDHQCYNISTVVQVKGGVIVELLTVREAGKVLKVSSITVRRYVVMGRLPAVKIGKGVRVHREAIDPLMTPVEPKQLNPASVKPHSRDPSVKMIPFGTS
jgi:excisionase family DNA binding protein